MCNYLKSSNTLKTYYHTFPHNATHDTWIISIYNYFQQNTLLITVIIGIFYIFIIKTFIPVLKPISILKCTSSVEDLYKAVLRLWRFFAYCLLNPTDSAHAIQGPRLCCISYLFGWDGGCLVGLKAPIVGIRPLTVLYLCCKPSRALINKVLFWVAFESG